MDVPEAVVAPEAVDVPATPGDPVAVTTGEVVEVVMTEAGAAVAGTIDAMTRARVGPSAAVRSARMTTVAVPAWFRVKGASLNQRSHPMSQARRSTAACDSSCAP